MLHFYVKGYTPIQAYIPLDDKLPMDRLSVKLVEVEQTEETHKFMYNLQKAMFECRNKHGSPESLVVNVKDFLQVVLVHNMEQGTLHKQSVPDIPTEFRNMKVTVVPEGELQVLPKWETMLFNSEE